MSKKRVAIVASLGLMGLCCSSNKATPPGHDGPVVMVDTGASDPGPTELPAVDRPSQPPDTAMEAPADTGGGNEPAACTATVGTPCFAGGSCCSGLICLSVGGDPAKCCAPVGKSCAKTSDCCDDGLTCVDGKCCGTSYLLCGPNDCCGSIGYYCNPGRYCSLAPDAGRAN